MIQKIEISIKAQNNALHNIKCYEVFNDKLDTIINNNLCKNTAEWDETNQLKKYRKKMNTNKEGIYSSVNVEYKRTKGMNYGRVFPENTVGLCQIRKEIRCTLCKENKDKPLYIDIDIKNAHFVILSQILKDNDIKCKYVKK